MSASGLAPELAGRRAVIFGGLGFIGSHLAEALARAGSEVAVVDALVPWHGGRADNIAPDTPGIRVEIADVRDADVARTAVTGADLVFNLAGQTSHLDSMRDPCTDLELNCRASLAILEACRHHNSRAKVVFASTRQLYGRPAYLPVDEAHPVAPVDVNGVHKAAAERYHLIYGDVYGLRVSVLRLTNTYGPRMRVADDRQTFLGEWLRLLLTGGEILIYGDGTQRRDFSYVDDVIAALLLAAVREEADGKVFNLGDRRTVSLAELAEFLLAVAATGSFRFVPFPPERLAIDIGHYHANFDLISRTLGWEPQVSLETGLERTIGFLREHGPGYWAT